jgi:predicted transcriptional regulator
MDLDFFKAEDLDNSARNRKYTLECEIDGKRHFYDVCCSDEHLKKLESDPNLEKIGEGYITYINGVKNVWPTLEHFFVRKDLIQKEAEQRMYVLRLNDIPQKKNTNE